MRSIDTNLLVRLLTGDDAEQLALAEAFVAPGAWVSALVLAETVWILVAVYEREPPQIMQAISMLLDHQQLTLQDPDVVGAALERYRKRPSLGFSDCLVLQISRKAGHLPLGSFDRNLARVDGAQLLK